MNKHFSQYKLIFLTAIFFVTFDNITFFANSIKTFPFSGMNIIYISSLAVVLTSFIVLLFSILSSRYTTKPLLIVTLIISSFTNYFMNNYNIIVDSAMVRNSLQTDLAESFDLLTLKLVIYVILLGLLPSYIVYKTRVDYQKNLLKELKAKLKTIVISFLLITLTLFSSSKFYTSFFREHKPLRYYTNPTYWIYGAGKYISDTYFKKSSKLKIIAKDAKLLDDGRPKLSIMVVGEALRADKFSLNGYNKETNPLLKQEDIINFSNFYSCGTATAESVPCMFSVYNRKDFNYQKGRYTQNAIDILDKTDKIDILWRDNNSDSKGVALRVAYQSYKSQKLNTICDDECRDEGMLVGLDEFIKNSKKKNILIVLHQMGNHGPAYYKRYPDKFKKFTPVCETNQFEKCSVDEINNAYDNSVLYTDYFLSKTINFLKNYDDKYETSLIYMSDHGESLGENGIYLHGLPYFMAPQNQKHIAAFMWFGEKTKQNYNIDALPKDKEYSHDYLFHTLLGLFKVQTNVYNKNLDILNNYKIKENN